MILIMAVHFTTLLTNSGELMLNVNLDSCCIAVKQCIIFTDFYSAGPKENYMLNRSFTEAL